MRRATAGLAAAATTTGMLLATTTVAAADEPTLRITAEQCIDGHGFVTPTYPPYCDGDKYDGELILPF